MGHVHLNPGDVLYTHGNVNDILAHQVIAGHGTAQCVIDIFNILLGIVV